MMMKKMMMQPKNRCSLEACKGLEKGLKPCTLIRCTLEERKGLEGLEKGLIDDAPLQPAPDADDDAALKPLKQVQPLQGDKMHQMKP